MSRLPELPDELKNLGQKHWLALQSSPVFRQDWSAQQDVIEQVFSLSDFIAHSCLNRPEYLQELVDNDLVHITELDYGLLLAEALTSVGTEDELFTCLRRFRNLHMLRLAWRDLLNIQTIESSLVQVSMLAQQLILQASDWLKQHLAIRFGLPMDEHCEQPLFVIGMGKLGGQELNFSSDIDLIFTYPQQGYTQGGKKSIENQQFFTKLAQKLIGALHQITTDGQVYRVDMRLRPFGESGPLVMHFDALEEYYQDQGREWERYAMLKGRILNSDSVYRDELEEILRPFIYRRYLDYGALDSLRKMKSMITKEVRRRKLTNNIKLGRGGIREAEFIVQSLQLIRGGREPRLQTQSLLHNLQQLSHLHILPLCDAEQLRTSYLWLRKIEHSLQQFADKQTQELPDSELGRKRLVHVLGLKDYSGFLHQLAQHSTLIHEHFSQLIGEETSPNSQGDQALGKLEDLWLLELTADESQSMLGNWLDSKQAISVVQVLIDFRDNLSSSRIGQRGENTLNKLMPHLLLVILSNEPHHASHVLARILQVFKAIYGRTAYLDLLYENQGAMKQLVKLCKASPWVTDQISRFPLLLDELLNPAQLYHPTELT
ncbi:MAG: glutamate-ammonia-ligase adenylyltransferase, partial [Paraglaciecola sp.]